MSCPCSVLMGPTKSPKREKNFKAHIERSFRVVKVMEHIGFCFRRLVRYTDFAVLLHYCIAPGRTSTGLFFVDVELAVYFS